MPKRFSQKCILSDAIILCCSNSTFIFVRFCSFWPCGQQLTVLFEKWEFCQEGCHCNLISFRSFCACRAMHTGLVWTPKTGNILMSVENLSWFFSFYSKIPEISGNFKVLLLPWRFFLRWTFLVQNRPLWAILLPLK